MLWCHHSITPLSRWVNGWAEFWTRIACLVNISWLGIQALSKWAKPPPPLFCHSGGFDNKQCINVTCDNKKRVWPYVPLSELSMLRRFFGIATFRGQIHQNILACTLDTPPPRAMLQFWKRMLSQVLPKRSLWILKWMNFQKSFKRPLNFPEIHQFWNPQASLSSRSRHGLK